MNFIEPYVDCFFELLEIDKGDFVLEVGTGEGRFIDKVVKEEAIYVGVDLSRPILNCAQKKLKNDSGIVHTVVADAEFLPFRDRAFDRCFCISTIFFIPNQYKAIREMGRTVKKDLVIDFRNAISPALLKHRLRMFLVRLRHSYFKIKLRVVYVSLRFRYIRRIAQIKYGEERVHRAITSLSQHFMQSDKKSGSGPYFPMLPFSIRRAFKSTNLHIRNVSGFDLPEYSASPVACCSILNWLKPALIIKVEPICGK